MLKIVETADERQIVLCNFTLSILGRSSEKEIDTADPHHLPVTSVSKIKLPELNPRVSLWGDQRDILAWVCASELVK
jgi:hypothetical protein